MDVPHFFSIAFSFDTVYWHTIVAISVSLRVVILIVTFAVAFQIFFSFLLQLVIMPKHLTNPKQLVWISAHLYIVKHIYNFHHLGEPESGVKEQAIQSRFETCETYRLSS